MGDDETADINAYVTAHGLDELLELFRILSAWDDEARERERGPSGE